MQNMVFWHFCSSKKEKVKAIKNMLYNQATSATGCAITHMIGWSNWRLSNSWACSNISIYMTLHSGL